MLMLKWDWFNSIISARFQSLTTLGGLFGGLSALFAGLAFAMLIITIINQQADSNIHAQKLEKWIQMQSFFHMFSNFESATQTTCKVAAPDVFRDAYFKLLRSYVAKRFNNNAERSNDKDNILTICNSYKEWEKPYFRLSLICFQANESVDKGGSEEAIDYHSYMSSSISCHEMFAFRAITYLIIPELGENVERNPFYDFMGIGNTDNEFIKEIRESIRNIINELSASSRCDIPIDVEELTRNFIRDISMKNINNWSN